jgi:hypothetical protein
MPLYILESNVNVGQKFDLCVVGEWKDSTEYLTSGTWFNLVEGQQRPRPQSCVSHFVQFQSSIRFIIRDIFNQVSVENAVVHFVVFNREVRHRFSVDSAERLVTANIIIPDVGPGIDMLDLQIESIDIFNQEDTTRNFTLCSTAPARGTACPESQISLLNETSHVISHLDRRGVPELFIVDKSVVQVEGQLLHPGPDPASTDILSCGIFNATVNAFDINSGELIQQTHTNGTGYFNIAVVKRTTLKLQFEYHNHTFVGEDNSGNGFVELLLLQNGYTVIDPITGLLFRDITMSVINITAAVTECIFDIGNYELQISVPSCPSVGTYSVLSNGQRTFSLQVPAHVYQWELKGFDGFGYLSSEGMNGYVDGDTIADRFQYMFPEPTRIWNVTETDEHTSFIFHPSVQVALAVAKGSYIPEVFPSSCNSVYRGSSTPFDFTLKGNSLIEMNFYASQVYVNESNQTYQCNLLPDGFILKLESDLGVSYDPCSANMGGCNSTFEKVDRYVSPSLSLYTTFHSPLVYILTGLI